MTEEIKQTEDELWAKVQKDRASTPAEDGHDEQPTTTQVEVDGKTDDPLAALPEPTRKLIEGLQSKTAEYDDRFQKMNQQLATANGTIGNLKQRLDDSHVKLQKITPTIEAVAVERASAEKATTEELARKRKEARDRAAELSPEFVDYVDMVIADAKPAEKTPEAKPEPKTESKGPQADEQRQETVDPSAPDKETQVKLMLDLTDRVPGWRKKWESPEFKAWLPKQSADIKAKSASWDPDEAASVFLAFDQHKSDAEKVAQVEKERQERLRRGEGVQGRGSSAGDVETGPDALWNKVKRDREKLRQSG